MYSVDDILGFFGKDLGMKPKKARPSAYMPGEPANVVHLPTVTLQPKGPAPQVQSTPLPPPVTEYKRPDPMEWDQDILTLLSEAEERARLPKRDMHLQGTGDGKGNTLYFGGNLGDRALTEDEAFEYIKQLDDYSKGEGFY